MRQQTGFIRCNNIIWQDFIFFKTNNYARFRKKNVFAYFHFFKANSDLSDIRYIYIHAGVQKPCFFWKLSIILKWRSVLLEWLRHAIFRDWLLWHWIIHSLRSFRQFCPCFHFLLRTRSHQRITDINFNYTHWLGWTPSVLFVASKRLDYVFFEPFI